MAAMAPLLTAELIKRLLLPVLVTLGQDQVPNIRMNVAKTLYIMHSQVKGSGELEDKVKLLLKQLSVDTDADVKFYALKSI
jgi:serine/threonine-protein phosphatase 2A regulatory subunit A